MPHPQLNQQQEAIKMIKLYISLNVYICCKSNHYHVKAVLIVIIAVMRVHTVRIRLLEEQKLVDSDDL